MELATKVGVPKDEGTVRLKLRFEDHGILTSKQVLEGLAASWFVVRPHVCTIADLTADVALFFGLLPSGILLQMENFMLPSLQPIWLLKDKDMISIRKRNNGAILGNDSILGEFNDNERKGALGMKLCAIEEFNKEIGGYESEKEEETLCADFEATDTGDYTLGTKKAKNKKQKNNERQKAQKLQMISHGRQGSEKVRKAKGKLEDHAISLHKHYESKEEMEEASLSSGGAHHTSKKKRKFENHAILFNKPRKSMKDKHCKSNKDKQVVEASQSSGEIQGAPKKKKQSGNDSMSLDKPHKSKKDMEVQGMLNSGETLGVTRKKRRTLLESSDTMMAGGRLNDAGPQSTKKVACDTSAAKQKEKHEGDEIELVSGTPVKKLSRSTLRKKAKRRWQSKEKALLSQDVGNMDDRVAEEDKACSFSFPVRNEDDGEAEEEKLPLVVRSGHIRFVHSDEDEKETDAHQVVVPHEVMEPCFAWNNGMSKRKGQSWGQQKACNTKPRTNVEELGQTVSYTLDFESLPVLTSSPKEGDLLAYRLVELAPTRTPELSEFRVGKVADVRREIGMLKLDEDSKYPINRSSEDKESELVNDVGFLSPYNEDGSLEVPLASLVDVRIIQAQGDGPDPVLTSVVDDNLVNNVLETNSEFSFSTPIQPPSLDSNNCHSKDEDNSQGLLANLSAAWREVAAVLERKKEELGNNGTVATEKEEKEALSDQNKSSSRVKKSNGGSRLWLRKGGGLGTTIALLRTQSALAEG